ncbi:MAG: hypothetical protein KUG77_27010 [Nannocystaceae bacterium]|nr:hypothetical protein [Nannocystaceae bacterium]
MNRSLLAAALLASSACAQIDARSTIAVAPRPELDPKWLGEAKTVVSRDLSLAWSQSLSTVEIRLDETRSCRAVLHQPVDRVESVDRTVKHGALYWEYGAGAAILATGLAALIKPEAFSPQAVTASGTPGRDTTAGYRLGGIFTALGAGLIGVGAYDTARSRDTVTTTRAYQLTTGNATPCISPNGPRTGVEVELAIGSWTSTATTDLDGVARFGLPGEAELGITLPEPPPRLPEAPVQPEAPDAETTDEPEVLATTKEAAPEPPPPLDVETTATVRVGDLETSFTLLAPFSGPTARERSGEAELRAPGAPRPTASP